jgi:hypothetical protein
MCAGGCAGNLWALTAQPAARAGPDAAVGDFSAARARRHLDALVGLGVRTVGSRANELQVRRAPAAP